MPQKSPIIRARYVAAHVLTGCGLGLAVGVTFLVCNDFRVLRMVQFSADPGATLLTVLLIPASLFAIGSALTATVMHMASPIEAPARPRRPHDG